MKFFSSSEYIAIVMMPVTFRNLGFNTELKSIVKVNLTKKYFLELAKNPSYSAEYITKLSG